MNKGQPLAEIAKTLTTQLASRRDFLVKTNALKMNDYAQLCGIESRSLVHDITAYAHGQFADYTGIPRKYYDRLHGSNKTLLAQNVNHWLSNNEKDRRLIRTMSGNIRALLSDKYKMLDNYDLAEAVLPTLTVKGCVIASAALTESRLYIKAVLPGMEMEVKGSKQKGDVVQAGIVISNSEIGDGRLSVEPFINRLVCLNGLVVNQASMKRQHLGRGYDGLTDDMAMLLSDETKSMEDKAFWLKVKDVVSLSFDKGVFEGVVNSMETAAQTKIENPNIPEVVEITGKKLGLADGARVRVLTHLIEGGDLTKWGLVNAVTRTAEDFADYETSTSLERAGGTLLDYNEKEWAAVAH